MTTAVSETNSSEEGEVFVFSLLRYVMKAAFVCAVFGAAVLVASGRWSPWNGLVPSVEVGERETVGSVTDASVSVEPISLDCRARVNAVVPVTGRREHKVLGRTYRTDTVSLVAVGDVDTCVDGGATQITVAESGATLVRIPAESIRFVRPRVDTVATAGSVEVSKGLVGKYTDQYPWVSDDLGLTPEAYAVAQTVIGSSECMAAAMDRTEQLITSAYETEAIERGADPGEVTVQIVGQVDLSPLDPADFDFDVWELGDVTCQLVDASSSQQAVGQ